MLLGAVGLVAIGVSGALAELLGRVFGVVFVPRLDHWMGRSGRSAGGDHPGAVAVVGYGLCRQRPPHLAGVQRAQVEIHPA